MPKKTDDNITKTDDKKVKKPSAKKTTKTSTTTKKIKTAAAVDVKPTKMCSCGVLETEFPKGLKCKKHKKLKIDFAHNQYLDDLKCWGFPAPFI